MSLYKGPFTKFVSKEQQMLQGIKNNLAPSLGALPVSTTYETGASQSTMLNLSPPQESARQRSSDTGRHVAIKWMEQTKAQKKRRAELDKILTKRSRVTEKMEESLKQRSLATKLLNSTFSIDKEDSIANFSTGLPFG